MAADAAAGAGLADLASLAATGLTGFGLLADPLLTDPLLAVTLPAAASLAVVLAEPFVVFAVTAALASTAGFAVPVLDASFDEPFAGDFGFTDFAAFFVLVVSLAADALTVFAVSGVPALPFTGMPFTGLPFTDLPLVAADALLAAAVAFPDVFTCVFTFAAILLTVPAVEAFAVLEATLATDFVPFSTLLLEFVALAAVLLFAEVVFEDTFELGIRTHSILTSYVSQPETIRQS